jgi:hypothetical protein
MLLIKPKPSNGGIIPETGTGWGIYHQLRPAAAGKDGKSGVGSWCKMERPVTGNGGKSVVFAPGMTDCRINRDIPATGSDYTYHTAKTIFFIA